MKINFHKSFDKMFAKLPKFVKEKFYIRLEIFSLNINNPLLNIHPLKGKRRGQWSINITGDCRALYIEQEDGVIFLEIGTHPQLYE